MRKLSVGIKYTDNPNEAVFMVDWILHCVTRISSDEETCIKTLITQYVFAIDVVQIQTHLR